MEEGFVTYREVAKLLNISPLTVRDWARTGKIPSIRLSHRMRRFSLSEILRWAKSRAEPGSRKLGRKPTPTK